MDVLNKPHFARGSTSWQKWQKKMLKPCFMFGSDFAKTAFFFQKAGEASVLELEK